jgi:hypothetical protein
MVKSRIAIRVTNEPSVVELEVIVPHADRIQTSIERLVRRHAARCLYSYVVSTGRRTILRAKIASIGGEAMLPVRLMSLLEDLQANRGEYPSPRAA